MDEMMKSVETPHWMLDLFNATGLAILGAHDPHKTTWDQPPFEKVPLPHQPSAYAREGLMSVLTGYGHEDIMLRKR